MDKAAARVIALGTFDGLHSGHQAVIRTCIELAREKGLESAVYTFIENPKSLFGTAPLPLMTPEEKRQGLYSLGVQQVFEVHFTRELAALTPEEFMQMLIREYAPAALVAGEDYTFGAHAGGTTQTLRELCAANDIQAVIVPLVTLDGEKISSTRIRNAIKSGDLKAAEQIARGEYV